MLHRKKGRGDREKKFSLRGSNPRPWRHKHHTLPTELREIDIYFRDLARGSGANLAFLCPYIIQESQSQSMLRTLQHQASRQLHRAVYRSHSSSLTLLWRRSEEHLAHPVCCEHSDTNQCTSSFRRIALFGKAMRGDLCNTSRYHKQNTGELLPSLINLTFRFHRNTGCRTVLALQQ